jgi:hypothetical protein
VSPEDTWQNDSEHELGKANADNAKNELIGRLKRNPNPIVLGSEAFEKLDLQRFIVAPSTFQGNIVFMIRIKAEADLYSQNDLLIRNLNT